MVKTTKIQGGAEYALVPDRLKQFREENPRASITTKPTVSDDGSVIFQVTIIKDKSDEASADATGSAMYNAKEMQKAKAFEKLETVATGRALSILGYLNNGQVASTEEMLEFEEYRDTKKQEAIETAIELISDCKTIDDLKETYMSLGITKAEKAVVDAKNKRKEELK